MPAASIIFERPSSIFGHIVAWKTGGDFSHVAVTTPGNWIAEAIPFGGVVNTADAWYRSTREGVKTYREEFTEEELSRGRRFILEAKKDGGYDFRAILSFILNVRRQDPRRWFCSELAYGFLNACRPSDFPAVDYLMDPESLRRFLKERLTVSSTANKVAV